MLSWLRFLVITLAAGAMLGFPLAMLEKMDEHQITYAQFLGAVDKGQIGAVEVNGNQISGHLPDGKYFTVMVYGPENTLFYKYLQTKGVLISHNLAVKERTQPGGGP